MPRKVSELTIYFGNWNLTNRAPTNRAFEMGQTIEQECKWTMLSFLVSACVYNVVQYSSVYVCNCCTESLSDDNWLREPHSPFIITQLDIVRSYTGADDLSALWPL